MKQKKPGIPKVFIGEDGAYECPECGGLNYLDSYDYSMILNKGSISQHCPMCETLLKISRYEQNSYSEL